MKLTWLFAKSFWMFLTFVREWAHNQRNSKAWNLMHDSNRENFLSVTYHFEEMREVHARPLQSYLSCRDKLSLTLRSQNIISWNGKSTYGFRMWIKTSTAAHSIKDSNHNLRLYSVLSVLNYFVIFARKCLWMRSKRHYYYYFLMWRIQFL